MSEILAFIEGMPLLAGILIFLAIFLLQTLLVTFPTYVLMFYGGMVYGIWFGSFLNFSGMVLTTTFGYILGSLGQMDKIMEHPSMDKFKNWILTKGVQSVGFLRIIPIVPYNVTSIGSGLLKIDKRDYFIVNNLALLPYTIIWAILGDLFGEILIERINIELSWNLLIPTIIFLVLVILIYLYLKKRLNLDENEELDEI